MICLPSRTLPPPFGLRNLLRSARKLLASPHQPLPGLEGQAHHGEISRDHVPGRRRESGLAILEPAEQVHFVPRGRAFGWGGSGAEALDVGFTVHRKRWGDRKLATPAASRMARGARAAVAQTPAAGASSPLRHRRLGRPRRGWWAALAVLILAKDLPRADAQSAFTSISTDLDFLMVGGVGDCDVQFTTATALPAAGNIVVTVRCRIRLIRR